MNAQQIGEPVLTQRNPLHIRVTKLHTYQKTPPLYSGHLTVPQPLPQP
jgi:hypothetical protein